MAIAEALSSLALGPLVEGACEAVGGRLGQGLVSGAAAVVLDRFRDHSQRLVRALAQAHARAWKALEIALAGDTFWERCQVRLARAEDQAFRARVRAFLDATAGDQLPAEKAEFRRRCLEELRQARRSGLLQPPGPDARPLAPFGDSLQQLADDRQLLDRIADDLRGAGHVHLAQLVEPGDRPSLLATAVRYFFRRIVEADEELFQGLAFARLEGLQEKQEHGFESLHQLLAEQGDRLESLLDEVQAVVVQTHAAVLDVQQELVEQGRQNRSLYQAVLDLQRRLDLMQTEVRPRDSLSIRSDTERRLVRQVVAQYRQLPSDERERLPALLNAIGKLEVAAGAFEAAERDFASVAALVTDAPARAEAHHNAYRAALERRDWDSALREFRQALKLDPGRFAPFPLERYEPESILGAGGTGVAFLCKDRGAMGRAVVKALLGDSLECGAEQLFAEARVLQHLDHPCIVRLRDCGFADPKNRRNPYLAMNHFDGRTLEEHVRRNGPLAPVEVTVLARRVAEALQLAHARNVLHRDVKPANLLVRASADDLDFQIIDFGLALRQDSLRDSVRHTETLAGASIAGTLDYAAPEQMGKLPGTPVGTYSDVYGFGKTICFALFGTPQPLLKHWQGIPEALANLLGLCLAEDPAERPVDFGVVLRYLQHVDRSVGYDLAGDRRARGKDAPPAEPPGRREERRPQRPSGSSSRLQALATDRPARRPQPRGRIPLWVVGVAVGGGLLFSLGIILLLVLLGRTGRPGAPPNRPVDPAPAASPGEEAKRPAGPPGGGDPVSSKPQPTTKPPPAFKPKGGDPEDTRVYLSDLAEFDVQPSPRGWKFGKNGHLGSPFGDQRITADGWVSEKGLCTHPTTTYGGAKYRIAPAETFQTWVGIDDSAIRSSDLVFKVYGDDKLLWESRPVSKNKSLQECRISVRGVKVLDLRVYPPEGTIIAPHGGHAVWLDPYVTRPPASGPPEKPDPGSGPAPEKPTPSQEPPKPPSPREPPPATQFPDLLAYWSFDEGTGQRAADSSGNDLHARLVEAGWTKGVRGKALSLRGAGSYLDYSSRWSRLSFPVRVPFTIAFWTRTTRRSGTLLSQRGSRDGSSMIDFLIEKGRVQLQFRSEDNTVLGPSKIDGGAINDGKWHHLAVTREGDQMELFLDAISQGVSRSPYAPAAILTDWRALGSERYWMHTGAPQGDPHFEGEMDELAIFGRPLDGKEIAELAGRASGAADAPREPPPATKFSGLLAYWSFDEGTGKRAADSSGNELHARLVEAGWADGIRGKALSLRGEGSYLDYSSSERLFFPVRFPFTIAFWTRTTRARGTLLSQRGSRDGSSLIDFLIEKGRAQVQFRSEGNAVFAPAKIDGGAIDDGEWHHLALTRAGDKMELFLDGVSQGDSRNPYAAAAILTDLRALGSERHWIRRNETIFGDPHFEGEMDEFCIFGRALDEKEIRTLAGR